MSSPNPLYLRVVSNTELLTKTKASKYLGLVVDTGKGTLRWSVWSNNSFYRDFDGKGSGQYVKITGFWKVGQWGLELGPLALVEIISKEEVPSTSPLKLEAEARAASCDNEFEFIESMVNAMENNVYREACLAFLGEKRESFKSAAAGRSNHHAYRGGLVVHTASVMKAALALASHYKSIFPSLDTDLIVAGALFHDSGKMVENSYPDDSSDTSSVSFYGEACGHITIGILFAKEYLAKAYSVLEEGLAPRAESGIRSAMLCHLIASHHGCLEWGSPVEPKCPEAYILHFADMADARLDMWLSSSKDAERSARGVAPAKKPLNGKILIQDEALKAAQK